VILCKHTITKSSNFQCVGLTHNPLLVRHWYVASVTDTVFCHVCLHSNFDIGFAISDVDFNTNKKVDISENMFL